VTRAANSRRVVVIPTYNERACLTAVVRGVRAAGFEVLVVDDASPDGTGELADDLARRDDAVHVRRRPAKAGLGSAYREGFAWALAGDYDVIGQMDADRSHDPRDLPRLAHTLAGCDVAIGSRWVPGGGVVGWPASRRWLSRAASAYVRLATGMAVGDATAGYRLWRRETLADIGVCALASDGYAFQVETALAAWHANHRLMEVPITFAERRAGHSKLSGAVVAEAVWRVALWGPRERLRGVAPRRVARRWAHRAPTASLT
jgi:glycosyltransferase involved in cell wall biosynthesis